MNKKNVYFLMLLILFIVVPVFSDENNDEGTDDYSGRSDYVRGNQFFSVNAGAIIPLFNVLPSAQDEKTVTNLGTLNVGFAGGFKWGFFLANNFSLGAELYGYYAQTSNRVLLMFPMSVNVSYFFKAHPFEFPVYLNLGFSFNSLEDYFRITPLLKPGAGAYWNINEEWSIGINAEYWFVPEIIFGDYKNQTSLANFCQINLSGIYHF